MDSAKLFVQTSEFAVNARPLLEDNTTQLRLDKWLRQLSFKSWTCLLESDNISFKAVAFTYAGRFHQDSLLRGYSYLLTDTTMVQLFTANGSSSPKIKLGELLSTIMGGIKEDQRNWAKEPEVKKTVSAFIKHYASHPGSYKPISFPLFSMGSDDRGLSGFKVRHEYEIKNNKGVIVKTISAFALDKNLNIHVIEKDSTSYTASYPPKLDYWLTNFGRRLNSNDSITLNLK
ncbi:MAG TPA: hypothetical protein VF476_06960 [Chitinophagaceae bacterium]